jgi:hypothetical protein
VYEKAREKVFSELLAKQGSSLEEWKARNFNAEKARKLMTEAGYPVEQKGTGWDCPSFPVEQVSILYNTNESNKATPSSYRLNGKQNLGITVPLKNMEFKTFLPTINKVEYDGFARTRLVRRLYGSIHIPLSLLLATKYVCDRLVGPKVRSDDRRSEQHDRRAGAI